MPQAQWNPVAVADVDLLSPTAIPNTVVGPVMVLVRLHTRTVGVTELDLASGESIDDHRDHLWSLFRDELEDHRDRLGCVITADPGRGEHEAPCLAHRRRVLADAPTVSV